MVRESQKQARNKWDAENMKTLGCKMRRDKAEAFQAICKARGTSPNEVFREAAEAFMREAQKETETEAPDTAEEG